MSTRNPDSAAILKALASGESCTASTTNLLEQLLGVSPKQNASTSISKATVISVKTTTTSTGRARSNTTTKSSTLKIHVEEQSSLSSHDRLVLATQTINTALQTLSEAAKQRHKNVSQPSLNPPTTNAQVDLKKQKPATDATKARPLSKRSPNSPDKRLTSKARPEDVMLSGLETIAECAHLAFQYTRKNRKQPIDQKLDVQIESGICSFVSKCLSLGLENIAIRELRGLKRRLDIICPREATKAAKPESKVARGQLPPKENLVDLLDFGTVQHLDSQSLMLLLKHQTHAIKLITSRKRNSEVNGLLQHLDISKAASPFSLLYQQMQSNNDPRIIQQAEALSQPLLSACPSISNEADAIAIDASKHISPDLAFQIQALVYESRAMFDSFSSRLDLSKDYWRPVSKMLAAFVRRSISPASKKFQLVNAVIKRLDMRALSIKSKVPNQTSTNYRAEISLVLSQLAQEAKDIDKARYWNDDYKQSTLDSSLKVAIATLRNTSLTLESQDSKAMLPSLKEAEDAMLGSLRGDSFDLDNLLLEVAGLRRILMASFLRMSSVESVTTELLPALAKALFACVHFLLRYIGSAPADEKDSQAIVRYSDKLSKIRRATTGSIESAFHCCKVGILNRTIEWMDLDTVLFDVVKLVSAIDTTGIPDQRTSRSAVITKVSNLFWLYSRQNSTSSAKDSRPAIKQSIAILQNEDSEIKEAGSYHQKLEQLARSYDSDKSYEKAMECVETMLQEHTKGSMAETLLTLSRSVSTDQFWTTDPGASLSQALDTYVKLLWKLEHKRKSACGLFDDVTITPEIRGLILERQLATYYEELAKPNHFRNVDQVHKISVALEAAWSILDNTNYPVRRLRVKQLLTTFRPDLMAHIRPEVRQVLEEKIPTKTQILASKDHLLSKYTQHLIAGIKVNMALAANPVSLTALNEAVQIWSELWNAKEDPLSGKVDQTEPFLQQLNLLADFYEVQADHESRLNVLGLLYLVLANHTTQDGSKAVKCLSKLSLQYLHMGYSGSAASTLARAQTISNTKTISVEVQLELYLVKADYLLSLANVSECKQVLQVAAQLATSNAEALTSANSYVSFHKLISHALHVTSTMKLLAGDSIGAMQDAKRSLRLLQRIWTMFENDGVDKTLAKRSNSEDHKDDSISDDHIVTNKRTPDALKGSRMWSLVPLLLRSYYHLSAVYKHSAMFSDSLYYIEQAQNIVDVVSAAPIQLRGYSLLAEFHIVNAEEEKGQGFLEKAADIVTQVPSSLELFQHHQSAARMWKARGESDDEIETYDAALALLETLKRRQPQQILCEADNAEDDLTNELANMKLDNTAETKASRTSRAQAKTRQTVPARRGKTTSKKEATPQLKNNAQAEFATMCQLQAIISVHKAEVLVVQDKLKDAEDILGQIEAPSCLPIFAISQSLLQRLILQQTLKDMSSNYIFGMLPESVIALPAGCSMPQLEAEQDIKALSGRAKTGTTRSKATTTRKTPAKSKAVRAKNTIESTTTMGFSKIRDSLLAIQSESTNLPASRLHEVCKTVADVSMLVSATSQSVNDSDTLSIHSALYLDQPDIISSQCIRTASLKETFHVPKAEILDWPTITSDISSKRPSGLSVDTFLSTYVDIIPEPWTAISMKLNSAKTHLFIIRYRQGESPFLLELPLNSQNHCPEEEFGFQDAVDALKDIIQESWNSTHNANYVNTTEAKKEWWAEREGLDMRMYELLLNIEQKWIGGFRGIFSNQGLSTSLLEKFEQALQTSLNRHLPSRKGNKKPQAVKFEPRVLGLFIGLGNPEIERINLDESLTDLLYFIVDILRFNGECNAPDEVDFDSLVIEVSDALTAYHSAYNTPANTSNEHTILILDDDLHCFPWESLNCLSRTNISRVRNLQDLKERIESMKSATTKQSTHRPGHHISKSTGSSLINPSGDLPNTEKILSPLLSSLPSSWTHSNATSVSSPPTFTSSLATHSLYMYFGHGAGHPFVSSQTVRNLPSCPTTLLMGCSSVALKPHGPEFSPTGALHAYLDAGAPAVVGALWDVTDKDCDRASVKIGEAWGLWQSKGTHKLLTLKRTRNPELARGAGNVVLPRQQGGSKSKNGDGATGRKGEGVSLVEAVRVGREECYLRYLNGAALVVYGIPVYLEE